MSSHLALPVAWDAATLARVRRTLGALPRRRLRDAPARAAAVLVPLVEHDGEPAVLFTKRSETVGTHKGHVSFPGGMADATDRDLTETALRELEEEIGIGADRVDVLGGFHEARAITGVRVVPIIGHLGSVSLDGLALSEAEIDDVFALRLRQLVDPAQKGVQHFGPRGSLPVYEAGPYPVWGLTAYILEQVLHELFGLPLTQGSSHG